MTLYSKILVLERVSDPKSYFYTLVYNICEIHVSFRKLIIRPKFVVYVPYYTGCFRTRYIFFYHRYPYQNYTLCENIGKAIRFNKGVRAILSFLKKITFGCEKLICSLIFMKIGIKLAAGILHFWKNLKPKKYYWKKSYKAIKLLAKIVHLSSSNNKNYSFIVKNGSKAFIWCNNIA